VGRDKVVLSTVYKRFAFPDYPKLIGLMKAGHVFDGAVDWHGPANEYPYTVRMRSGAGVMALGGMYAEAMKTDGYGGQFNVPSADDQVRQNGANPH